MFGKIKVARQIREFLYSSWNKESKKLYSKCYRAYVFQCIILGKDEFKVKFGSEYYDSFRLRVKDWLKYIWNNIDTAFCKCVPANERPSVTNYYINRGVPKPIHLKHHAFVSESAIEYFCSENGLTIYDEYLGSLETIYYIKRD